MRERLRIESVTHTRSSFGEGIPFWTPAATLYAESIDAQGSESVTDIGTSVNVRRRFRIRARAGLSTMQRMILNDRLAFDILAVVPADTKNRWMFMDVLWRGEIASVNGVAVLFAPSPSIAGTGGQTFAGNATMLSGAPSIAGTGGQTFSGAGTVHVGGPSLAAAGYAFYPTMLTGIRVFLHAPYEAARRSLTPGRTVEDRFNRADSNTTIGSAETGQAWVISSGTFGISSNRAYAVASTSPSMATIDSGLKNCETRCTINLGSATSTLQRSTVVRCIDASNCLFVRLYSDGVTACQLFKLDGGVETSLKTGTVVGVAGSGRYIFRIVCNETSIKTYINGTLDIDHTLAGGDATKFNGATCTRQGLYKNDANTATNNWWEDYRVDPLNTTAAIEAITDDSGNGFGTAQASVTKQLILLHDGTRWVFRQDGIDDIQTGSSTVSTATAGYLLIAVAQEPTLTAACAMFASADEASTTRFIEFGTSTSPSVIRYRQNNAGTLNNLQGDTVLVAGSPYIIEWASDDTTLSAIVNGVAQTLSVASGANNGSWFGDTSARDNSTVGALKTTSESLPCNADLCTIILCDNVPDATTKTRARQWANNQNALGLSV